MIERYRKGVRGGKFVAENSRSAPDWLYFHSMASARLAPPRFAAFAASVAVVTLALSSACSNKGGGGADAQVVAITTSATVTSASASSPVAAALPTNAPPPAPPKLGAARRVDKGICGALGHAAARHRIAAVDLKSSFVDGDDDLALVNRSPTGALSPDFVPKDLVDIRTLAPPTNAKGCEAVQCLRKEAATALRAMMDEMAKQGFPGKVESAYRSYANQCGTFQSWVRKGDFCGATEQSALPGHSQHQLGTTVDLFTEEWAKDPRGVFRENFGCTPAGKWLQTRSWEYGFVMPYPIHPDDEHPKQKCVTRWDIPIGINPRTGYRYEHWHYRYVGKELAAEFYADYKKSDPALPTALTFEQWLRKRQGYALGDAELPVCDGCNCGACATLGDDEGPCKDQALRLQENGLPVPPPEGAKAVLVDAKIHGRSKAGWPIVRVKVRVPEGMHTQTPITGRLGALYGDGGTFTSVSPYPATLARGYPTIGAALRIGVEAKDGKDKVRFPWRVALSDPELAAVHNRANLLLPARPGEKTYDVEVPTKGALRVTVLTGEIWGDVKDVDR
jgi:D-alanyl-D-alanine carboxypeptidase